MNNAFKNNPLLAQLKATIVENKPRVKGLVKGSRKSHGFLVDEQGKSHFIAPPMMKRLLDGDKVEAVIEVENGRELAVIEKVVASNDAPFYAQVKIKNDRPWAEPESPFMSNWAKIMGSDDLKDGDWIQVSLTDHPFQSGKASVKVIQKIAEGGDKSAPWKMALHRHAILPEPEYSSPSTLSHDSGAYEDLTSMRFVTIDGDGTMDVDDALYCEQDDEGYKLWIAIADPEAFVPALSELDREALKRAVTTYMPGYGYQRPMLPTKISEENASLLENVQRKALVCSLHVDRAGDVSDIVFKLATVCSQAKLTYEQVAQYLNGENNLPRPEPIRKVVKALYECSTLLREARKLDAVLPEYGDDVRFIIQEGRLQHLVRAPRNVAHLLVEECMVVGNRAFAAYCKANEIPCVYRTQKGIADDAVDEAAVMLKHWGFLENDEDIRAIEVFAPIARALETDDFLVPRVLLRSMMDKAVSSYAPAPHFGMGFDLYATFTSPIRKYSDLINHRMMKAHLTGTAASIPGDDVLAHIDERAQAANKASREVERHLYAQYFEMNNERAHEAVVMGITKGGLRLEDVATGASVFAPSRLFTTREQDVQIVFHNSELWVDGAMAYRIGDKVKFGVEAIDPIGYGVDVKIV